MNNLKNSLDWHYSYDIQISQPYLDRQTRQSSPAYQRVRRVRFACSRRGAPGRLVLRLDATQDTHPADRRPPPLKCVPPLPVGARRDRPRWARGLRGMRAAGWDEDARADTQADEFSLFNPKAEKSYGRTGIEVAYLRVHERVSGLCEVCLASPASYAGSSPKTRRTRTSRWRHEGSDETKSSLSLRNCNEATRVSASHPLIVVVYLNLGRSRRARSPS